jgi:hypothetical protein
MRTPPKVLMGSLVLESPYYLEPAELATRSVLNKSGVDYGPEEGRPMPCGWSARSLRADEGSFVLAR